MRVLASFLVFACLCGSALAQSKSGGVQVQKARPQSQQSRSEQILGEPDRTRTFQDQGKSFGGTNQAYTKSASVKPFYFLNIFRPKKYDTGGFAGSRSDWQGNFQYETSAANTKGKYVVPNAGTEVPTRRASVKKASESGKEKDANAFAGGSRPFLNKGKSQKELDAQYGKKQAAMTIDQVRELLNKN